MPNRILKESICYSDDLDCLTAFEETVFYRLMVRVDDYGRLDARPAFLRSQLFTTRADITEEQICSAIDHLVEVELVAYYTVADKPYLYIRNWQKHQRLRCTREKYPPPFEENALSDEALQPSAASCGNLPQTTAEDGSLRQSAKSCGELLLSAARVGAESESQSQSESEVESEVEVESQQKARCGAHRFIPPTVEQVDSYCQKRKYRVSAQRFVDFYASKGWLVGTSPMTDWRAAVRRWEERNGTDCGGSARASPQIACRLSTAKKYESEDCI
ncbi:hypothetical protein ACS3UN_10205 [Oscillospiraceae bacterium LTW-04]|nr:hypothetical protein RBH76_11955 [Oscillospiraceae bacterium MB24-C1]